MLPERRPGHDEVAENHVPRVHHQGAQVRWLAQVFQQLLAGGEKAGVESLALLEHVEKKGAHVRLGAEGVHVGAGAVAHELDDAGAGQPGLAGELGRQKAVVGVRVQRWLRQKVAHRPVLAPIGARVGAVVQDGDVRVGLREGVGRPGQAEKPDVWQTGGRLRRRHLRQCGLRLGKVGLLRQSRAESLPRTGQVAAVFQQHPQVEMRRPVLPRRAARQPLAVGMDGPRAVACGLQGLRRGDEVGNAVRRWRRGVVRAGAGQGHGGAKGGEELAPALHARHACIDVSAWTYQEATWLANHFYMRCMQP